MILARVFSKIYRDGGIILIDSKGQKYICGNPDREKPIIIKLLKKNLNWKLVLDPEIEFPEGYMRNEIIIENASLKDFLMDLVKNLGRKEVNTSSYIFKSSYSNPLIVFVCCWRRWWWCVCGGSRSLFIQYSNT